MSASAPVWWVNPYRRREVATDVRQLITGTCPVPDDVEHCHGAEIQHQDGMAECWADHECTAPGGLHLHVHRCERGLEPPGGFAHRCRRCRRCR